MKPVKSHGAWLQKAAAHHDAYLATPEGQRNAFVKRLAAESGQAANTIWRQLAALNYLITMGIDVKSMTSRPALMSVEAVARVGRSDALAEARLLKELASEKRTRSYFRSQAAAIEEARLGRRRPDAIEATLESVLHNELHQHGSMRDLALVGGTPLEPFASFEGAQGSVHIYRAVHADPRTRIPNFQTLFTASVLASLSTVNLVIVCSDIELRDLEALRARMRPDSRDRLSILAIALTEISPEGKERDQ